MKKIVFFDIDGTLIDDATQTLPESALEAVAALRRQGHLAILNTGRPYSHIDPRVLQGHGMAVSVDAAWRYGRGTGPCTRSCQTPPCAAGCGSWSGPAIWIPVFEANGCMILDRPGPRGLE